ncbi:hypothetical protein KTD28_06660 [Burkholderia gladioli]|uniref:hypothetical protein n=1 Tax=Burkholderia gladioli TaxID=28095 RepID=UPI0015E6AD3D|nr:hypothetical protein [Burkholderia gladioli]MBA1367103.1 hypothetical protein [Burkholderia gladioli]MBU9154289.1 hypothetical protein [Burkholderia gladioli]
MKMFDHQSLNRQEWLHTQQAPRVITSDLARQSNFEKSTIVRVVVVVVLLIIAVDLAQEVPYEAQPSSPTEAQPAARHLTA